MKILAVCRGSRVFLDPLIKHWQESGHTLARDIHDADAIFVEWANEQSVAVTQAAKHKNIVIRVHGSEYFQNFHDVWYKEKVYAVIKANPAYVIPGVKVVDLGIPVDSEFWKETGVEREKRRLIMAGSFVYSKNHLGLLQILSERPDYFTDIIFVGDIVAKDNPYRFSETRKVLNQVEYYATKYKLPVKVKDKVTPEQLQELYSASGYVASPSINEGCHLVISEGILCGCKPLIYDWLGAERIYGFPTYHNVRTFWDMVDNYPYQTQTHLKSVILEKFDKSKIFSKIDDTLFEAAREWL